MAELSWSGDERLGAELEQLCTQFLGVALSFNKICPDASRLGVGKFSRELVGVAQC